MVYQIYNINLLESSKKIYHIYEVNSMKRNEKRSEFISYRTDKCTKEILEQIAAERKWTISQLTEEIIKEWIQKRKEDKK